MSKIRITTYDTLSNEGTGGDEYKEGLVLKEDRLVEMSTEFKNGPKEKHNGPIRVEATLTNQGMIEELIEYLKQLALDAPIAEKTKSKSIPKTLPLKQDSITELINTITKPSKKVETIEDTLLYLRSLNFTLLTRDHWDEIMLGPESASASTVKLNHQNYQIMARQLKVAKDAKNDKYDNAIFFAVKILGNRFNKIQIYTEDPNMRPNGTMYHSTVIRNWKEVSEVQFKVKQKFYKFPKEMDYEQRSKWRVEDRKLLNAKRDGKEFIPSRFYLLWKEQVTILQPLKLK